MTVDIGTLSGKNIWPPHHEARKICVCVGRFLLNVYDIAVIILCAIDPRIQGLWEQKESLTVITFPLLHIWTVELSGPKMEETIQDFKILFTETINIKIIYCNILWRWALWDGTPQTWLHSYYIVHSRTSKGLLTINLELHA